MWYDMTDSIKTSGAWSDYKLKKKVVLMNENSGVLKKIWEKIVKSALSEDYESGEKANQLPFANREYQRHPIKWSLTHLN